MDVFKKTDKLPVLLNYASMIWLNKLIFKLEEEEEEEEEEIYFSKQ